jgi:hypothetical protein
MRGRIALGVVGVLAMSTIAACGGDDDSSTASTTSAQASATTTGGTSSGGADASEDDYIAAIVAEFRGDDPSQLQLSEEQAGCVAPKWLDVITVERLHDKGITPAEISSNSDNSQLSSIGLSDAEAGKMVDAFGECDVDLHTKFVDSMAAGTGMTASDKKCLGDALSADMFRRLFVASITKGDAGIEQDQQLTADFSAAIGKCATTATTS